MPVPLKETQTAYQRFQEDLDYRLDQMSQARQAAFDAVNKPAKSSRPSGSTKSEQYNDAVRRQRQLQKLGFYHGKIDGDWKGMSERAHRTALNNGYMLNSYGMYVKKPEAYKRSTPDATDPVRLQQAQLKQLGFYKGKVDGKFWDNSKKAHQAALDAGYVYENGVYKRPGSNQPESQIALASIFPTFGGSESGNSEQSQPKSRSIRVDFPNHGIDVQNDTGHPWLEKAARFLGIKRIPLGHSGVIFVDENGKTKYYDYGRYSNDPNIIGQHADGNYRRISVPDMKPGESLDEYTARLSAAFPDESLIQTRMYEGADINAAERKILADAANKDRDSYNLFLKSCKAIAKDAAENGLLMPIGESSFYLNNKQQ